MATQQLNALKTINTIQRDGSLQNLLLSIKQAKTDVDAFAKAVNGQKTKLVEKKQEEERKKAEAEAKAKLLEAEKAKQEQLKSENAAQKQEPAVREEKKQIFSQGKNQTNNFRKFDGQNAQNPRGGQSRNGNFAGKQGGFAQGQGNRQFQQKPGFGTQQNKQGAPFRQNGQATGQGKGKTNPFVSTKANGFKSFAQPTESSAVLAQPERNFGNKNKQRRNIVESKKVSARAKALKNV